MTQKTVTANDMQLFLRDLYFAAHYCYPPYLPKTDVGADPPPPLSLLFPTVQKLNLFTESTPLRPHVDGTIVEYHESLLTLAHYLDCAQMMQQCEAVMLTIPQKIVDDDDDDESRLRYCWMMLKEASRHRMDKLKASCLATMAADRSLLDRQEYKFAKL